MGTKKTIKKHHHARGFPALAGFLLIVVICAVCPYYAYKLFNKFDGRMAFNPPVAEFSAPELQVQTTQYERKIYPYSIIRGGVRSREELSAHIRSDSVVAEHYSDFDVSKANIIRAPEARFMHVSYRLGDKVYWTANKIKIPLGEILITDGNLEARARCGNLLSDTQMTPLSGEEPDAESFNIPQTASLGSSELEPFIEPGLTPSSQFSDEEVVDPKIPLTGESVPPALAWVPSYPIGSGYFPAGPITGGGKTPGDPVTPEGSVPPGITTPPGGGSDIPPGGGGDIPPGGGGDIPPGGGGDIPPGGGGDNPPVTSDVPEPGTMVMVLTGLAIAAAIRIRQIKQ